MREVEVTSRYIVDAKGHPSGFVQKDLGPPKSPETPRSWRYVVSTSKPTLTAIELREIADILDRRNAREKEAATGPVRSYD